MGKHDSGLRHKPLHGASLCASLHTCLTESLLDRALELERMESGVTDQFTGDV